MVFFGELVEKVKKIVAKFSVEINESTAALVYGENTDFDENADYSVKEGEITLTVTVE